MFKRRHFLAGMLTLALVLGLAQVSQSQNQTLTIYSGRGEALIGPLIKQAEQQLGINIRVRYGDTAELAIAILEEGRNSPADIFFAQDAGALGALQKAGRTRAIPAQMISKVDSRFRSPNNHWVGITGRARVLAYNTNQVNRNQLPNSISELTQPKWRGRVGWAPTNGSFQSFVTAMRLVEGDAKTLEWLQAMRNNGAVVYRNNTAIVEAVGRGEVDMGLTNNYYLYRFLADDPNFPVAHHYTRGDTGSLINIAGVAILDTARNAQDAQRFIQFLLTNNAQNFFARETKEYPLVEGIPAPERQLSIDQINPPRIDLANLADLQGTLVLLQRAGVL
ncbi:iron ABC transporter substrate-binding protein [Arthrospira platensis]|jgi:iron(III) transport system substrate-binding protein|uniref:Iron ABC transporter substrate binding protein n=1 Tax=Limnospira platensis NIES-46 TaxID=1236695 RepID=A0A5M3TC90_LIMPL|nr:iron ABC transporter substrate-binding protein [Arthrospira platensis]AMW26906.1 ABC transporter substrate-binding protein [Arthrospira platensis YZ]MBD2670246.1 iron ABC transporter substrate-binding protein [Arthrospira platensis FACHB-439]MBD2710839.1 iron ABC transporter substrate-binding protein [Arthrospira platensis FACHB-835]MDF2211704.1 iron ABC transporter substrate-binding protein [Arthrospira platensis NCB002]MDT9183471.1 iron ABC transporter substrate-binding protein [Limnospir